MKRKKNNQPIAAETEQATEEVKPKKKSKLVTILVSVIAGILGVAIIVIGIALPFLKSDEFTDEEGVNPIAAIELSNGMTLTYELYESTCPTTVTNFIYLAEIGYFDGTVVFDGQNGWVRFGGWQTNGIHRGDANDTFHAGIKDRVYTNSSGNKVSYINNKFGYRIKKEDAEAKHLSTVGALTFCYERSATEFQILANEVNSPTIDGGGEWLSTVFAMPYDNDTTANVKKLAALSLDDGTKFAHDYFRAPLAGNSLITIKSVKVTKKYEGKWKSFDFMDYMRGTDGASRCSWSTVLKKTGEK